jgi:mycoredoxin
MTATTGTTEADQAMATLTIYSTTWCGPCIRLKAQLDRVGIVYEVIDIEAHPEAETFVMEHNHGNATVPTVVFPDGSVLTNPSVIQVQARLGLSA